MNTKLLLSLAVLTAVAAQPAQGVTKKQIIIGVTVFGTLATAGYWAYSNYGSKTEKQLSDEEIKKQNEEFNNLFDRKTNNNNKKEKKTLNLGNKKDEKLEDSGLNLERSKINNKRKKPTKKKLNFDEVKEEKKTEITTEIVVIEKNNNNEKTPVFGGKAIFSSNGGNTDWMKKLPKKKTNSVVVSEEDKKIISEMVKTIKTIINEENNMFKAKQRITNILKEVAKQTQELIFAHNNKEIAAYAKNNDKTNFVLDFYTSKL